MPVPIDLGIIVYTTVSLRLPVVHCERVSIEPVFLVRHAVFRLIVFRHTELAPKKLESRVYTMSSTKYKVNPTGTQATRPDVIMMDVVISHTRETKGAWPGWTDFVMR